MTPRARRRFPWLIVGGLLLAAPSLAACDGTVECMHAGSTYTIIGRLVVRDGAVATFSIESIVESPPAGSPSTSGPASSPPPVLRVGRHVTVNFFRNRSRFLKVGTRYRVGLYWDESNGRFESDVHVSGDPCSRGTVYANGQPINTAGWVRSHLVLVGAFVVLVPLAIAVFAMFTVSQVAARRRARRNGSRDRTVPPS